MSRSGLGRWLAVRVPEFAPKQRFQNQVGELVQGPPLSTEVKAKIQLTIGGCGQLSLRCSVPIELCRARESASGLPKTSAEISYKGIRNTREFGSNGKRCAPFGEDCGIGLNCNGVRRRTRTQGARQQHEYAEACQHRPSVYSGLEGSSSPFWRVDQESRALVMEAPVSSLETWSRLTARPMLLNNCC